MKNPINLGGVGCKATSCCSSRSLDPSNRITGWLQPSMGMAGLYITPCQRCRTHRNGGCPYVAGSKSELMQELGALNSYTSVFVFECVLKWKKWLVVFFETPIWLSFTSGLLWHVIPIVWNNVIGLSCIVQPSSKMCGDTDMPSKKSKYIP